MSTALTIILSLAMSFLTPALVESLIGELVEFLDSILSKRGLPTRWMWGYAKSYLTSPAFLAEVKETMGEIEAKLAMAKAERNLS
jgi:hypothetical protein